MIYLNSGNGEGQKVRCVEFIWVDFFFLPYKNLNEHEDQTVDAKKKKLLIFFNL